MVWTSSLNVVGVELGLLEKGADVVVVESVLDLVPPTTFGSDQARVLEKPQLVRNGRLADPGHESEIAHAERPGQERVEQLRPRLVAKCSKSADDQIEGLGIR